MVGPSDAGVHGWPRLTFAAIELVVGVYDDVIFFDHMIQHLMLLMLAAPLYAMGAPVDLLDRASTGRVHDLVARALRSKVAEVVGHPATGFLLYGLLIPLAHLTSLYNYTLTHDLAHDNEHLMFLVVGYLFWRPVVAIEPSRHRLHPGLRLVYLALAIPVDTFTGIALISAANEMFPYYSTFHRAWGPSLVGDLHLGGSIMWIGGDSIMAFAMIPVAVQWVRYEEARTVELDARLDAEAPPRRKSGRAPVPPRARPAPESAGSNSCQRGRLRSARTTACQARRGTSATNRRPTPTTTVATPRALTQTPALPRMTAPTPVVLTNPGRCAGPRRLRSRPPRPGAARRRRWPSGCDGRPRRRRRGAPGWRRRSRPAGRGSRGWRPRTR